MTLDIDGGDMEEASHCVQVRFVTKLKPPLKATPTSIAIPSNLTRMGLSSIEKILEIEYIKAVVPRKEEEPSLHDDWVSVVDGSHPGFIVTGCYDGLGRIWKAGGLCTYILEGHSDAVSCVSVIHPEGIKSVTVATGSKDRTLRLWKLDTEESNNTTKIWAYKVLRGHKASVQSVAAQPSGAMVCSGSWDCTINLWRSDEFDAEGHFVAIKKRIVGDEAVDSQLEGEAVSALVGHTQCVSSVVCGSNKQFILHHWTILLENGMWKLAERY